MGVTIRLKILKSFLNSPIWFLDLVRIKHLAKSCYCSVLSIVSTSLIELSWLISLIFDTSSSLSFQIKSFSEFVVRINYFRPVIQVAFKNYRLCSLLYSHRNFLRQFRAMVWLLLEIIDDNSVHHRGFVPCIQYMHALCNALIYANIMYLRHI